MALQKSVTLHNGFEATSAYHKINKVNISFDKETQYVSVDVIIWKDIDAKNLGKDILINRVYDIPIANMTGGIFDETLVNDANFIKKAYIYLKTLDDYTGAIDV